MRNDNDIKNGISINDKIKEENEFFKKNKMNPSGVLQMRRIISNIQFDIIKEQIPNLLNDIDAQINKFGIITIIHG